GLPTTPADRQTHAIIPATGTPSTRQWARNVTTGDEDRGQDIYDNPPPFKPVFDYSHDGIMRSFEESLQRLQLDRVDVLHIHDLDDH
ncbi:MAG TPA: hypothetical protein DIC52_00095, partial [Candidatus Latescibacteria bacterium]|nr:hypothetical protein [Candidatus Latescibacterota bacterium]